MNTFVTRISRLEFGTRKLLPVFAAVVPAGFPSPADDHLEPALDLNELLVHRPPH